MNAGMRLIVYGRGGHGREMALAARREVIFHSDDRPIELRPDDEICIAVGDPGLRQRLAAKVAAYRAATIIAPSAVVDPSAEIAPGAQIADFCFIGPNTRIGRHFHCNVRANIHHDCAIGDFVTISPGVLCLGNVTIGDGVFIGSGAILRNGKPGKPLVVGLGAVVGMGAVVTRDVAPGAIVYGNPAREQERSVAPRAYSGRRA